MLLAGTTLRHSFLLSYLVLFASTLITFIESIRTRSDRARHILNLETAVSVIASYVYGMFLEMLDDPRTTLADITRYRYMDWFITTPMLLLAILLFFNFYNKRNLPVSVFLWVAGLNMLMLTSGYLGETGRIHKVAGSLAGFVFFVAMLWVMWLAVVRESGVAHNQLVFGVFGVIWSMYGVAYFLQDVQKNVMYNMLDVISKSLFGLFMWLYYGRVVAF